MAVLPDPASVHTSWNGPQNPKTPNSSIVRVKEIKSFSRRGGLELLGAVVVAEEYKGSMVDPPHVQVELVFQLHHLPLHWHFHLVHLVVSPHQSMNRNLQNVDQGNGYIVDPMNASVFGPAEHFHIP